MKTSPKANFCQVPEFWSLKSEFLRSIQSCFRRLFGSLAIFVAFCNFVTRQLLRNCCMREQLLHASKSGPPLQTMVSILLRNFLLKSSFECRAVKNDVWIEMRSWCSFGLFWGDFTRHSRKLSSLTSPENCQWELRIALQPYSSACKWGENASFSEIYVSTFNVKNFVCWIFLILCN